MSIEPFKDLIACGCWALLAFAVRQAVEAFAILFGGKE